MPMSGKEMLKLYLSQGWVKLKSRSGHSGTSHVKVGKGSERQTIPMHSELDIGLEKALLKRLRQ